MTRFLSTISYLNEELTGRRGNMLTLGAAVYQPPIKAAFFGVDPSWRGLGRGPPRGPEDRDAGGVPAVWARTAHLCTLQLIYSVKEAGTS